MSGLGSFTFRWSVHSTFLAPLLKPRPHKTYVEGIGAAGDSQANLPLNRDHPAEEVYVTGTFDDWGKTVKLEKDGTGFSKTVETLPLHEKVYYKVRPSNDLQRALLRHGKPDSGCSK